MRCYFSWRIPGSLPLSPSTLGPLPTQSVVSIAPLTLCSQWCLARSTRRLLLPNTWHQRHAMIVGLLPEAIGRFDKGSLYRANEVSALRWVHATLVETALMAHDLVLPALTLDERERYWADSRLFGALFGLMPADLPADWASFVAHNEAMVQSDILSVSAAARDVAGQIFSGGGTWLRSPRWYLALSVQMLPERLRMEFGFCFDEHERSAADRALAWIRRVYPTLPTRLRTVGPYQEAQARLQGETQLDWATRWLNRIWIGRPQLDGCSDDRAASRARSVR